MLIFSISSRIEAEIWKFVVILKNNDTKTIDLWPSQENEVSVHKNRFHDLGDFGQLKSALWRGHNEKIPNLKQIDQINPEIFAIARSQARSRTLFSLYWWKCVLGTNLVLSWRVTYRTFFVASNQTYWSSF